MRRVVICAGAATALVGIIAAIMISISAWQWWNAPAEYYSKCLGCGTEFVSDEQSADVTVCPNCPMSEEEFNQLIEELKRDTVQ